MNCIDLIKDIAGNLNSIIQQHPDVVDIPTPDYGWINHRYCSPSFRLAHIEIFDQNRFGVVHCCVFPHATDPSPIFGFDVIAGENKITGVFMDLSPTVSPVLPFLEISVSSNRQRPDWGDIFSDHWLASRPTFEEMQVIGKEAQRLLLSYLRNTLGKTGNEDAIRLAQNHYCEQQRKNIHTRRALETLLGQEGAEEFMSTILFPACN